MLVTKSHPLSYGFRQRTIGRTVSVGALSFRFLTIAMIAVLVLFYLIQSSQGASNNLKAYELQQEKEKLSEEVKRLELEAIRLRSLNEIQKNATGLEPVEQVNYLPEPGSVSLEPDGR